LVAYALPSKASAHSAAIVQIFPCMTFPWLRGVKRDASDHAMRHEDTIMPRVVDAMECRKSCPEKVSGTIPKTLQVRATYLTPLFLLF
jgi:hypothetical protein